MKKLYILFLLFSFLGFSQNPGDVIVTEIMNNPAAVSDVVGEWFELYNTTGSTIDIDGWVIRDTDADSPNSFTVQGTLEIVSDGYITLGRGLLDPNLNGGVPLDYSYGDGVFTLGNGGDEIVLETGSGIEINRVEYTGDAPWPDLTGESMSLNPTQFAGDNNDGSNWCASTTAYGDGDLGTPGAVNDACCELSLGADVASCDSNNPGTTDDTYTVTLDFTGGNVGTTYNVISDSGTVGGDNPSMMESGTIIISDIAEGTDVTITVDDTNGGGICSFMRTITSPVCIPADCANPGDIIITEILQDAGAVSDTDGEWFEVFNTTNNDIDMEGWVLSDLGNNSHTIVPSGGTTVVPANGYLVIGRSTDTAVNGGAPVDYAWDIFTLSNTDDEIIISCGTTEIDRVEYTGVAPWPDPTGSSMELSTTAYNSADNDLGSNWGVAVTPFGDGDNGTPGTINDFTLSVDQFNVNSFNIYPNPVSNGIVNINSFETENIKIEIYDILGKQVGSHVLTNNQQLNVSKLNAGLYILKISQNSKSISKKLIIK